MYVIEVIPLAKMGGAIATLSYYSATSYAIGTIIEAPVRKKLIPAMVTATYSVADGKTNLKQAAFTLQKLPPQQNPGHVPLVLQKTAELLTTRYPATTGTILYHLLTPETKQGSYRVPATSFDSPRAAATESLLTDHQEERYVFYRSHIRETLARRGSVIFVAPTGRILELAIEKLGSGIEDRLVRFLPGQGITSRKAAYEAFDDTSLAKVIFTTPSHAYLSRVDILSVIIEQSGSDLYIDRERPYIDHREGLRVYARHAGCHTILGDILPTVSHEYLRREELMNTIGEPKRRIAFPTPSTIITELPKVGTTSTPFNLFSPQLTARMESILANKGNIFLYSARRGLAPLVTCQDCGYIFRCPDSGTPYALHATHKNGIEKRWFVSSRTGKRIPAPDTCPLCHSWRLKERGIGVQTAYQECTAIFPRETIVLFDHETAHTAKRADELLQKFYEGKRGILIGTSRALPYLARLGVDLSVVLSYDALRATPIWNADESALRLLLTLREYSRKELIIQTRSVPDQLLTYAERGTIDAFYDEELSLRNELGYPPHKTFVLLTWQGTKASCRATEATLLRHVTLPPTCYSRPDSTEERETRHALWRITNDEQAQLMESLRFVPPYIKMEVNPLRLV